LFVRAADPDGESFLGPERDWVGRRLGRGRVGYCEDGFALRASDLTGGEVRRELPEDAAAGAGDDAFHARTERDGLPGPEGRYSG
jgi:hypothetical protein